MKTKLGYEPGLGYPDSTEGARDWRLVVPSQTNSYPDSATPANDEMTKSGMRGLISKVLSPALQLWLRSQVESVKALQFLIEGGDRQILAGYIPKVTITAQRAVYQGLHFSQVSLAGEEIRINLPQIMQGKPLRLLAVIPVSGEVILQEDDLNASLRSPLLSNALTDLLLTLLRLKNSPVPEQLISTHSLKLANLEMKISDRQLTLSGTYQTEGEQTAIDFAICTCLSILKGTILRLDHLQWRSSHGRQETQVLQELQSFEIDLGRDVALQELTLGDRRILCRGSININP